MKRSVLLAVTAAQQLTKVQADRHRTQAQTQAQNWAQAQQEHNLYSIYDKDLLTVLFDEIDQQKNTAIPLHR
jgi:hypothetical protein